MIEKIGIFFELHESGYGWATLVILAIVGLTTYWLLNRSPVSNWFKASEDIVPPYIAVPAVLFALLVTALATDVWQKHVQAKDALIKETAAVSSLMLLAAGLGTKGVALEQATRNYVDAVVRQEWEAMIRGDHANKGSALPELGVLDFSVSSIGNEQQLPRYIALRLHESLETIRVNRLQRISLAHDAISIAKWASSMVLAVITLVSVAIVHLRRPRAMIISIVLTVLCQLATIHVLSSNRSPYVGTAAVHNSMLIDALKVLEKR
jgi:hypothetical protein